MDQMLSIDAFETHRRAITGHCYRMLGSFFDAEDAAQETFTKAWRSLDHFDNRSSVRTWLYRIATNVCLDELKARTRRVRPTDIGTACLAPTLSDLDKQPAESWIEPIADAEALPSDANPAELAILKESIHLAFVSALQRLPPRQRAAFLLADVLDFSSAETAAALDLSTASVNSALQRARDTLDKPAPAIHTTKELSELQQATVSAYVDAFERYDIPALTSLLRADVTLSMPPYALWLRGPASVGDWMLGLGSGCRGSRLRLTAACGSPAFAQYRPNSVNGHQAWALIVLELTDDQISGLNTFLDVERLFPKFGLPLVLAP